MDAIRFDRVVEADSLDPPVVLGHVLRKQLRRTVFSVDGVAHRLRLVSVEPGADGHTSSVVITVTTDRTRQCAHVLLARERLEYPEFVASLLAHAIRAVLTGELPADGVEGV